MTVNRQWQHGTVIADSSGLAWYQGYSVSGDHVVTGGGYAEAVNYNASNESSTETNGNSAQLPLVGVYTIYSGGNTSLMIGFKASPNTKVRVHSFTTWEA